MIQLNPDFPSGWRDKVVSRQINLYVDSSQTPVSQDNIVMNSIEITQTVCDGKFHLGGVIASMLTFTVNNDCISAGASKIKAEEVIVIDNAGTETTYTVPLGTYYIDRTDTMLTQGETYFQGRYVAYDAFVTKADKVVTEADAEYFKQVYTAENRTLYNVCEFVRTKIGIYPSSSSYTIIQNHDNNDRMYINIYRENDEIKESGYFLDKAARDSATYRDVLSAVAVMLGGAFIYNRQPEYGDIGETFKLVQFDAGAQAVLTLSPSERMSSTIDTETGKPIIRNISYTTTVIENPITYNTYTDAELSLGDISIVQSSEESARGAQSIYVLREALKTLSKQLGNWEYEYGGIPVSTGDPLELTDAEIQYFGDPRIEAGDYIRCTRQNGTGYSDFYVMDHVYRLRSASVIRSYGTANNSIYTSSRSPSYGETKRPAGYDSATSGQISKLFSTTDTHTTQITDLTEATAALETSSVRGFKSADLYSSSALYAVGDVVVYSGVLYICIEEITVVEAFDPTKWEAITNASGYIYIQPMTETAYDTLVSKDNRTLYVLT